MDKNEVEEIIKKIREELWNLDKEFIVITEQTIEIEQQLIPLLAEKERLIHEAGVVGSRRGSLLKKYSDLEKEQISDGNNVMHV